MVEAELAMLFQIEAARLQKGVENSISTVEVAIFA
jgi:hypothetical protein